MTIPTKAAENVLVRPEMKEIVAAMDVTAVGMKEVGYMPLEVNVGMSGVGLIKVLSKMWPGSELLC